MKIYCAYWILGKYVAPEDHTQAYRSVIIAVYMQRTSTHNL